MPRYAVTFGFVQHIIGATETYITGDVTGTIRRDNIQNLIDLRNGFLFSSVQWTGVRVTQIPDPPGVNNNKQKSAFMVPGIHEPWGDGKFITIPRVGGWAGNASHPNPDQARACIIQRFRYDTDRWARRFLAFASDDVLMNEPGGVDLNGDPLWTKEWQKFIAELVSGRWYIKARRRDAGYEEIPIVRWVQSQTAPANIGVVVNSLPAPGITENMRISIKGTRRRGTDRVSYNGQYTVRNVNEAFETGKFAYYLQGTESGDPDSVKKNGTIQRVGHNYYTIQAVAAHKVGVHKRGKPLGTPVGKRLKRISLDP